MKPMNDLFSFSLLLVGIFLLFQSLREPRVLIQIIGIVGSITLIMVEAVFLWKYLRRIFK